MKKKRIQYNELFDEIYYSEKFTQGKKVFLAFFILFLAIISNFSIEEKINNLLLEKFSKNSSCPIYFEKIEFSFLIPKMTIKRPEFSAQCFGNEHTGLNFQDVRLQLALPSLLSPSLNFSLMAKSDKSFFNLVPALTMNGPKIIINNSYFQGDFLNFLADGKNIFTGKVKMSGEFQYGNTGIGQADLQLSSHDLRLSSQNMKGFQVPDINFKTLKLEINSLDGNELSIDNLKLGDESSSLKVDLSGKIYTNRSSFSLSRLELSGNLKLSPKVVDQFAFLKLFFQPEAEDSTKLKIKVNGTINAPKFN